MFSWYIRLDSFIKNTTDTPTYMDILVVSNQEYINDRRYQPF